MKHSLNPFQSPHQLINHIILIIYPSVKTWQLGVSRALCGSSEGFLLCLLENSVLSLCSSHSERGSKEDRVETTNPSAWPFHPLTHTLPLICWVITCPPPSAGCLFTQLTRSCLMFSRSQTGPGGGLQSRSQTQTHMTVTHLSTVALSESAEGLWFVPKPVVVNMQT